MTNNTCRVCQIRRIDPTNGCGLCEPCYDYAGWENIHSDDAHGTGPDDDMPHDCPVCFPELAPRTTKGTGHTNTVAKTRGNHDACYAENMHPKTPAGRAACRADRIAEAKAERAAS